MMHILKVLVFVVLLPLGAECRINVENFVEQLPVKLRSNQRTLANTLSSLEVLGSIHPKLAYYRIQYLNMSFSDSSSISTAKVLLSQFNATRDQEIRRKHAWLYDQLKMLDDSTSFFEYSRLKKYLHLINDKPPHSIADTIPLKPADRNGINYFAYINELNEIVVPYDEDENYALLLEENRNSIYDQYHEWSEIVSRGSIPCNAAEILRLLDFWYLFNGNGKLSPATQSPFVILYRDYFRILLAQESSFNFAISTILEEREYTMVGRVSGDRLRYLGWRLGGAVDTPNYLVTVGYSGNLIPHSNLFSSYAIEIGTTVPVSYEDIKFEVSYSHEISVAGHPIILDEVTYPQLKFTNISISGIYGAMLVSIWKPTPSLSIDLGYSYYSEKRRYNFEFIREYSTYIISSDGVASLDRLTTEDLILEQFSHSYTTGNVILSLDYKINNWLNICGEYNSTYPKMKLVVSL